MSTIKKNKYANYYFSFIDKKGVILIVTVLVSIITIIYSIQTQINSTYMNILDIHSIYDKGEPLWPNNIFDYGIPFIGSLIVCWSLYYDYSGNAYRIMTFYNKGRFNNIILMKYKIYVSILMFSTIIAVTIKYSIFLENSYFYFILLLRFITPILYISSIALIISVFSKNTNIAIAVNFIYIIIDMLSNGRYTKLLGIQGNSHYLTSVELFYYNRSILLVLSVVFIILACRRATRI